MRAGGKRARRQERSRNTARRRGPTPAQLRGSSGPEQGPGVADGGGSGGGEDGGDDEDDSDDEDSTDENDGDEQPTEDGESVRARAALPHAARFCPAAAWQLIALAALLRLH